MLQLTVAWVPELKEQSNCPDAGGEGAAECAPLFGTIGNLESGIRKSGISKANKLVISKPKTEIFDWTLGTPTSQYS
jgi:hypothetical protein